MRSKLWLLTGIALCSALVLFGATQTWVTFGLEEGAAAFARLELTGVQLSPSLSPIAIAGLAAALALTIVGRVFRFVLGALVALFGIGVALIGLNTVQQPRSGAASRIAEATGIIGDAQYEIIAHTALSSWPLITVVFGGVLLVLGLLTVFFGRGWKSAGRKYQAEAGQIDARESQDTTEPDRISDWEAMNDGDDPSRESNED